ncbi:uncharacterized protein [Clytia hemisphaerica]|uniref:uncharacterized protein isoform X1 n=1 Tax=Clytia hemisphaerica TaxID=252671 RepID=UPI0034D4BE2E
MGVFTCRWIEATIQLLFLALLTSAKRYWDAELDKQLEYLELADCPYQVEAIGCYKDDLNRALPSEILNSRDRTRRSIFMEPQIQWTNYNHWLANFICQGARKLFEKKPNTFADYIGVQFYGEIWANLDEEVRTKYNKYGSSLNCVNGNYKKVLSHKPTQCGLFVGDELANYVYKVTRYNKDEDSKTCPYFESSGCWADNDPYLKPHQRPMTVYKMNERDPYINNWNKKLIDWGNWGKGYLGDLLCRCAELAKKENMKYFSIQFYGECWLGNNETNFKRDEKTDRCVDNKFDVCDVDQKTKCRAQLCAGKWKANKVYELKQGPHKCATSPCKNEGKCLTIGTNDYVCQCKKGFGGDQCEKGSPAVNPTDEIELS